MAQGDHGVNTTYWLIFLLFRTMVVSSIASGVDSQMCNLGVEGKVRNGRGGVLL
jgi:hypothetical protein